MNYEISISQSGKYIIAKVIGDMTIEVADNIKIDGEKLAIEKNIKHLLLDLRLSRNTEKEMSNLAYTYYDIPTPVKSPFVKTAFLITSGDNSHDLIIAGGKSAGHNFQKFTKEKEAIEWLNKIEAE